MRILLACSMLLVGIVACVNAPDPDTRPEDTDAEVSSQAVEDTAAQAATVPDELQLPATAAACRRANGVCTNIHICEGSGRHTKAIKCPGQNVCCVP